MPYIVQINVYKNDMDIFAYMCSSMLWQIRNYSVDKTLKKKFNSGKSYSKNGNYFVLPEMPRGADS